MGESEEVQLFVNRLKKGIKELLDIEMSEKEIQCEYLLFGHDEIEVGTIPDDILCVLTNPFAASSLGFSDNQGDYYKVCHIYYVGPNPYEIWMKNDAIIDNPIDQPRYV